MYRIFVEVRVAGTGAIDVFPGRFVVEAKFVGRNAYDWTVLVMTGFDKEGYSSSKETQSDRYWTNASKEWPREFRKRVEVQSIYNDDCEICRKLPKVSLSSRCS